MDPRRGEARVRIAPSLTNPFLSEDLKPLAEPDWSRLALWGHLRKTYLGLDPDPGDRTGIGFVHG